MVSMAATPATPAKDLAEAKEVITNMTGVPLSDNDSLADAVRGLVARISASDASIGKVHEQVAELTSSLAADANAGSNRDGGTGKDGAVASKVTLTAVDKEVSSLRQQLVALQQTIDVALPRNTGNIAHVRGTARQTHKNELVSELKGNLQALRDRYV